MFPSPVLHIFPLSLKAEDHFLIKRQPVPLHWLPPPPARQINPRKAIFPFVCLYVPACDAGRNPETARFLLPEQISG
jgi:hypothetical protein